MAKIVIFIVLNILFIFDNVVCNEDDDMISPISTGFGPYYVTTTSVENCTSEQKLDVKNRVVTIGGVRKISRTEEEYVGKSTVPNDIHVIRGMAEFLKWQDGGFRTEFKKYFNNPCKTSGTSYILKKSFHPDENCNIKKGVYNIEKINTNEVMHSIFRSYHYNRYMLVLDWFTTNGSLGCFKTMCEIKPLKKPKKPKRPQKTI